MRWRPTDMSIQEKKLSLLSQKKKNWLRAHNNAKKVQIIHANQTIFNSNNTYLGAYRTETVLSDSENVVLRVRYQWEYRLYEEMQFTTIFSIGIIYKIISGFSL